VQIGLLFKQTSAYQLWFQVTNVYLIDSSITGVGESPDPIMNDAPDTVLYLIENPFFGRFPGQ
jgi:hypothetical protein